MWTAAILQFPMLSAGGVKQHKTLFKDSLQSIILFQVMRKMNVQM